MTLAEKITTERKKIGYSQEELAEVLCVSRQSVSKWELGASLPEIDKIIAMSEIFSVSCDYLLKDNDVDNENIEADRAEYIRTARDGDVRDYLTAYKKALKKIAIGVMLLILSPAVLILLAGFVELGYSEITMTIIGLSALFVLVAAGVAVIIPAAITLSSYRDFEEGKVKLSSQMKAILEEQRSKTSADYSRAMCIGAVLCILSVLPLIITSIATSAGVPEFFAVCTVPLIFVIICPAVYLFITKGSYYSVFMQLLAPEGTKAKEKSKLGEALSSLYWCSAAALYLLISFLTSRWDITWLVWPVAALFWGGIEAIITLRANKRR